MTDIDYAIAIIKGAVIENGEIDIFGNDQVLYKDCEFRWVKLIFRENARQHTLHRCYLTSCEIVAHKKFSKSEVLLGYNTAINCMFNGELLEDYRTNGGRLKLND